MGCSVVRTRPRTRREALLEEIVWLRETGDPLNAELRAQHLARLERSALPSDNPSLPDPMSGTLTFWCGEIAPEVCSEPGCLYEAEYLCDYPIGDGKKCDLRLCTTCRTNVGTERDFCPVHAAEFRGKGGAEVAGRGDEARPWPPRKR